jgi:hypothetical protein
VHILDHLPIVIWLFKLVFRIYEYMSENKRCYENLDDSPVAGAKTELPGGDVPA